MKYSFWKCLRKEMEKALMVWNETKKWYFRGFLQVIGVFIILLGISHIPMPVYIASGALFVSVVLFLYTIYTFRVAMDYEFYGERRH